MADENKRVAFTLKECAKGVGLSRDSIRRAIARREIRAVRIGRRILVPASEMARLLSSDTEGTS
jgi:excisionase family DNA binding protein